MLQNMRMGTAKYPRMQSTTTKTPFQVIFVQNNQSQFSGSCRCLVKHSTSIENDDAPLQILSRAPLEILAYARVHCYTDIV